MSATAPPTSPTDIYSCSISVGENNIYNSPSFDYDTDPNYPVIDCNNTDYYYGITVPWADLCPLSGSSPPAHCDKGNNKPPTGGTLPPLLNKGKCCSVGANKIESVGEQNPFCGGPASSGPYYCRLESAAPLSGPDDSAAPLSSPDEYFKIGSVCEIRIVDQDKIPGCSFEAPCILPGKVVECVLPDPEPVPLPVPSCVSCQVRYSDLNSDQFVVFSELTKIYVSGGERGETIDLTIKIQNE